jgi:molybdate transport system ATP-binding protein
MITTDRSAPFITLNDITIRRSDRLVFPHTTCTMRTGERWAILGANGSGKSTLAQAIAGALPVVRGEIVYHFANGHPRTDRPWSEPAPEERIAHVSFDRQRQVIGRVSPFEQARWHSGAGDDALTVREFLTSDGLDEIAPFLVSPRPLPAAGFLTRVQHSVRRLHIGDLLDRRVSQLSNGEMRKVLIAHALAQAPQLLILDDPFGGLDAPSRQAVHRILRGALRSGPPVLLVAARRSDVPPEVTHLLLVANDKVIASGTRNEMLAQPARASQPRPPRHRQPQRPGRRADSAETGTPDSPLLRMRNVGVRYGGVQILRGVTWEVLPGQRWALMGPNGAGKSTLLSVILGDNPQAYANQVEVFGHRRGSGESIWDIKRGIGYLSPEMLAHYQEDLSCRQVVCSGFFDSIGLYDACSRTQLAASRSWLERLGIGDLARKSFLDVSDGLQRLVLLARALVKDPALLILDEPCQGLDAAHRDATLAVLDRVCTGTNRAMIYVTHRREELPACITHIVQLRRGRMITQGSYQDQ